MSRTAVCLATFWLFVTATTAAGQSPASLIAGLPQGVPGVTVNRLCASGLNAIVHDVVTKPFSVLRAVTTTAGGA